MKCKCFNQLSILMATYWKSTIEIWRFYIFLVSLLAIETLQNHFIFRFLILNFSFRRKFASLKRRLLDGTEDDVVVLRCKRSAKELGFNSWLERCSFLPQVMTVNLPRDSSWEWGNCHVSYFPVSAMWCQIDQSRPYLEKAPTTALPRRTRPSGGCLGSDPFPIYTHSSCPGQKWQITQVGQKNFFQPMRWGSMPPGGPLFFLSCGGEGGVVG
jgi:hypothetical protein